MKAIDYLRKFDAAPKYDRDSILATIIFFTHSHFNSHTIMEPDCLSWVQDGWREDDGTHERFEERCSLILYTTAGDVRASMPYLVKQDDKTLYELMIELMDLMVMYQGMAEGDMDSWESMKDTNHWAKLWNNLLGIKKKKEMWSNKAEVIEAYSSDGRWEESAQEIVDLVTDNILDKAYKLVLDFHEFMKTQEKVFEFGAAYEIGRYAAIEGSHVRVIDLALEDADDMDFHTCLMYWAPMPRIEAPEDAPEEIKAVCKSWSAKKRTEWFDGIHKQDQKTRDLPQTVTG
jgi:hypothetical protein